jgi:hypothetical protein
VKPGDPVLFVGSKGPTDWIAHRADLITTDGNAVAKCADKRARRAMAVAPSTEHLLHWCVACWTDAEIAARCG